MNLGSPFSLKVSTSGMEVVFQVFIQVAFSTSERLCSFFSSLPWSSISGVLQSWMQIRPLLWLILSQANDSTSYLSWNCEDHSDFIVERSLLLLSLEISMTNLDSLIDLMVAGLLPISRVKLFSIAYGLNFLFFSGSILHLKCVGYDLWLDLGDSSSPAMI